VRGVDGRPTRFVASLVDIGAKRAAELRIADSERRYRALVETSPSLIWTCDSSARITFVSDRACRNLYGLEPGEVLGRHVAEFSAPGFGRRQFLRRFAPLLRGRPVFDVEAIQQTRGRAQVVVLVSAVPIAGPDGALQSVFGVCSDITSLKRRESELSVALRNQQALFDAAGEGIVFLRGGVVERVNRALVRMLGVTREALLGRPLVEALVMRIDWSAFERATFDAALRGDGVHQDVMVQTQSGRAAWCQLAARAVGDGAMILVVTDVTALKQREELAWHQANHDELTGLPNRRSLIDHARRLLSVATRQNLRAALLVIDLDGFKQFNDQFGHAYGDALLRRVALRMASVVREYDVVARTGGDEFVVMLPYIESAEVAALVAEKLVGAIAADNLDAARSRAVTASIGIALAPEDGHDFDTLMARADAAMYAAKASGKNQWAMALALRPRLEAPLAAA
jgi:diguanylate cyclase (GGDEF)-like protein/PAS domain S-box-containing protein